MTSTNLPLLTLFNHLQEAGLPLGIEEYQLLLRALQGGFGIADQDALYRLCRMLWIKSDDEERLLRYHFDQTLDLFRRETAPIEPRNPIDPAPNPKADLDKPTDPVTSPPIEPIAPPLPNPEPQKLPKPLSLPKAVVAMSDEVEAAKVLEQAFHDDNTLEATTPSRFATTDEYFPVTRRQMKQSWRYLRRFGRQGIPVELDVDATVKQVGQQGILLKPVMVPRRINLTELVLLIDQDGSMVPFHPLARRLVETALRGGRLGKVDIYYFHNCPIDYLYANPSHREAKSIPKVVEQLRSDRTGVLIFSDAGAARGGLNPERTEFTEQFLDQLHQKVRYVAWLNPMPRSRWIGTTAYEIASLVPMFEFTRQGLDQAIDVLRGRHVDYPHLQKSPLV